MGLVEVEQHAGDPHYRRTLAAADYQLVLTAATALEGTPIGEAASSALLAALDLDFDGTIKTSAIRGSPFWFVCGRPGRPRWPPGWCPTWKTSTPRSPIPRRRFSPHGPAPRSNRSRARGGSPPLPETRSALRGVRLRFVMRTGRWFEVELLVDEAPVHRAHHAPGEAALLRRPHVPPGSSQLRPAGRQPRSQRVLRGSRVHAGRAGGHLHARGTLGCPPGGRDTGDGQVFINLRDNPRLDYDYTVWGRVISGLSTIDTIQEGDSILKVEIRSR